jgi:hypothetical protein
MERDTTHIRIKNSTKALLDKVRKKETCEDFIKKMLKKKGGKA